tara:strand:+ start:463 stop:1122 length:660 start_codon:yes stop_codon:yes gene_type:complete
VVKLVVFDWDGTLMDSVPRIVSAMQETARTLTLPVPSTKDVQEIIGISLEPAIERLFGRLDPDTHQAFLTVYRDEYVERNATPSPLFDGALPLLKQLKNSSLQLAVATGKARRGLDRVLLETHTRGFFSITRCSDESEGKPSPKMLLEIMAALEVKASETVLVGDSIHDMQMANNAGVAAIGVSFGTHSGDRLRAQGAIDVIDELSSLPNLLQQIRTAI